MPIVRNDDQNRQNQSGQSQLPGRGINTGAAAGNGVGTPASFSDLYKSIRERSEQQQAQQQQEQEEEKKEATFFDNVAKSLFRGAEDVFNFGGAQDFMQEQIDKGGLTGNPVGTLGALALTLPGGIIGSPIRGVGGMYEALTGRDAQSVEDGQMNAQQLDASQRAWSAINAGIDLGGGFVGGSGRVLGAGGKALSQMDNAVGRTLGKLMPNEGRGLVSKELADMGKSKAVQIGGQVVSDMAEEGAEEFIQTFAEHGRAGDEFNGETLDEAVQSGVYGAIGGGMMSGAGLALNSAIGGKKAMDNAEKDKPDSSGFPEYGEVKESVPKSRQYAAPSAQVAYDTMETKPGSLTNNGFGLVLAPGGSDIGLDESWIGIEGLRAQWLASDEDGKKSLSEMLGIEDQAIIQEALDANDFDTLNQNIGGHHGYNRRSVKRDPGTSNTTVHDVWVTKVVPGNKMQLHPLTSQLANGDIDGDVKTVLDLPGHDFLLPSQLFLNPDGTSDYNLDYLPNLDTEAGRTALRRNLGNSLQFLAPILGDAQLSQRLDSIAEHAAKAKNDQSESGAKFLQEVQDLAHAVSQVTNSNVDVVSDAIGRTISTMYDTINESEVVSSLIGRYGEAFKDLTTGTHIGEGPEADAYRWDSGSVGNAKTKSAIAYNIGEIHSLAVGLLKGASLREGQADKYGIAKRNKKMWTDVDHILYGAGQNQIDQFMAELMKIVDYGENINENITNLFNIYVLSRFRSEVGFGQHNRIGDGLDPFKMLDTFIEIRNEIGKAFNESITKTFTSGYEGIVGSIPKTDLKKGDSDDRMVAVGYLSQVMKDFRVSEVFDVPTTNSLNNMFIEDMIDLLSKDALRNPIYNYVGEDGAELLKMMVNYHKQAPLKMRNDIIAQLSQLVQMDNAELSLEESYATATWVLESVIKPLNQRVILESDLTEIYKAAKTKYARDLFAGDALARANVQVSASIEVMYRDVVEAYAKFLENGDSRWLEMAKQKAAENLNGSSLTRAIYHELNTTGTIEMIKFFSDIRQDFDLKSHSYKLLLEKKGFPEADLLIDALSIGQDTDSLKSSIRDNEKAVAQASYTAMQDAIDEGAKVIDFMRKKMTSEEQKVAPQLFGSYVRDNSFRLNDDIFASLMIDSTDTHLHDSEKGTTIESAAMFFQQMELFGLGGPTSLAAEMQGMTTGSMSLTEFLNNKIALVNVLFNGKTVYLWDAEWAGVEEVSLSTLLGHPPTGVNDGMSVNDLEELFTEYPQIVRVLEPHMITPSLHINEDGGVGQVGTEKATGSLCNGFQAYIQKAKTDVGGLKKANEKNAIEIELLQDKRFAPIFSAFLVPNEDGTIDYQEILDKKAWLVDCLYEHIGRGTNVEEIKNELLESGMKFFSRQIVGDAAQSRFRDSDRARIVASGDLYFAFDPVSLVDHWKAKTAKKMKESGMIDVNGINTLLNEGLLEGYSYEDLKKSFKLFNDSFRDVLAENQGINDAIDDINGGVFAILGKENTRNMLMREFGKVFRMSSVFEKHRGELDAMMNEIVDEVYVRIFDDDKFFYREDIDTLTDDQIREKINRMMADNKAHHATIVRVNKTLDKALSQTNANDRREKVDEVRIAVNDMIVANAVNDLGTTTDAQVNEYFIEDANTIVDAFGELYEELRKTMDVTQHKAVSTIETRAFPTLRAADPRNMSHGVMAGRHASESQIATNVAVNGYVMTQSFGWAMVPHYVECNAGPSDPIPVKGVDVMSHLGEEAILLYADGETRRISITESTSLRNIQDGTMIQFYDSAKCTCPMCRNHNSLKSNQFAKDRIRAATAYIKLLDYAQEAKNLKLKKALEITGKIVPNATKSMDEFTRISYDVPAGATQEDILNAARNVSNSTTDALYKRYFDVLKSYEADEKIPMADIMAIAEMNSSVMLLTGVNGEKSFATLYELNDEAIFSEIIEKLGGGVIQIKANPVSYEQINAKIEMEVLNACRKVDGVSVADINPVAIKALQEWRNHGTGSMNIKSMMSMMPLVQKGGPSNIIPGTHHTAEQAFRKSIKADGHTVKRFVERGDSVNYDPSSSVATNNRDFQGKQSVDQLEFLITNVEIGDDWGTGNELELDVLQKMRGLNYKDKFYGSMPSATVIASRDASKYDISRMIEEGYKGYDLVFVPSDLVSISGVDIPFATTDSIFNDMFTCIDLRRIESFGNDESGFRYSQTVFDPAQVWVNLMDRENFYGVGDAAIYADPVGMQNYKVKFDEPIEVEFKDTLSLGTVPKLVSGSDLADVARQILNDEVPLMLPEIKRIGDVEGETRAWLRSVLNDQSSITSEGYVSGGVRINSIMGLMVQYDTANNAFYMPAFATGNIPQSIDHIRGFKVKDGKALFYQDTLLDYSDAMLIKATAQLQASKGEMSPYPADSKIPFPRLASAFNDNHNVMLNNENTTMGRIEGNAETLDKQSLYYLSRIIPTSLMFKAEPGGGVTLNDMLNVTEDGADNSWTPADIDELFSINSNSVKWWDVVNGIKPLVKDPEVNRVIMKLASEAMGGNNVILSTILCPYGTNISMKEYFEGGDAVAAKAVMYPKKVSIDQVAGVFKRYTFVDMMIMYNGINPVLCQDPRNPDPELDGSYIMNQYGEILSEFAGQWGYHRAMIGIPAFMENDDRVGERQVNSAYSAQQRIRYSIENGMSNDDVEYLLKQTDAKYGNLQVEHERMLKEVRARTISAMKDIEANQGLLDIDPIDGVGQRALRRQIRAQEKTFDQKRVTFVKSDGTEIEPSDLHKDPDFIDIFNSFKRAMKADGDKYVSDLLFINMVKMVDGWSYSDGDGSMKIDLSVADDFVRSLDANLKKGFLIEGKLNGTSKKRSRVSFGLLPKNVAQEAWEVLPRIRETFLSLDEFEKSMMKQEANTMKAISTFLTTGRGKDAEPIRIKREALNMMHYYLNYTYGIAVPDSAVYSSITSKDVSDSEKLVMTGLFGQEAIEEFRDMIDRAEEARDKAIATAVRLNKRGLVEIEIGGNVGDSISFQKSEKRNPMQKALDGSVDLMRIMAVLDLGVTEGSLLEGAWRNAVLSASSYLPIGPWNSSDRSIKNPEVYTKLAEREDLQQFVKILREASLRGDIDAFLMGVASEGKTIEDIAEEMYGNQGWWPKVRDRVFKIASMDTVFLKNQTANMLRFLDTYITDKGYPEHMRTTPDGRTMFEVQLEADPVKYLCHLLGPDSSVRTDVGRAINTSDTVSFAQRNAVSMIIEDFTKRSSVVNALTAFSITPFIRYTTNVMGRMLNWFMPISSMNYVMVDTMSKFDTLADMGVEQAQVYTSLRKALMVDAAKMSFTAVAAIILALGLLEPPDDEDKRGDYREYLFFGHRIYEDWVLTDLTGPIFPYACLMRSVFDGKPRFDVLFNGLADVASKNPLLKVGEVLNTILSPDMLEEELASQSMAYEETVGGEPSIPELIRGNTGATVLSLASKLFTPSFIRNWGKSYQYQRSYNTVWDPNDDSAVNLSTGDLADTVKVDYDEAMIRKVTRDNPIIGVVMNLLTGADTSYTGITDFGAKRAMTPVIVQDPIQRAIRSEYSIGYYDTETGEYVEKSQEEKEQVALDIIATLQSYSDMEELYETGFMLDGYTREYVGDIVWQTVAQIQTEYYNWAHSSESDYYVLGDGDYWTGSEIKQQAYNAMNESVQYWKDFYYNKLNSEPMRRGIQQYLRENVEWFQDDNGEWYASGFNKGMTPFDYLGFKAAPGSMDNPDGTMGYYGDWDTPSAVVPGMSTGERALVPLLQKSEEYTPFDELADNHPEIAAALEKAKSGDTGSSSGNGGSSYGSRRSGGGGGGGGGSTNLYSRPASTNIPSARTISTSRPYGSQFDYLRPGFETKGSREASRRSDF